MAGRKKTKRVSRKKAFQKRQDGWKKTQFSYNASSAGSLFSFSGIFERMYLFLVVFLILGATYLLFYSPIFSIENSIVDQAVETSSEDVKGVVEEMYAGRVFGIFPNRNIFIISSEKIEKKIVESFPSVYYASVKKDFPNILRITLEERSNVMVWKRNDTFHYVADDGVVTRKLSPSEVERKELPLVESLNGEDPQIGEVVTNSKIIRFVDILQQEFTQKTSLEIESYALPSSGAGDIHIKTKEGPVVYFSLERTAESQIQNLILLLQDELGGSISGLEYIDMRVGNWVYYK